MIEGQLLVEKLVLTVEGQTNSIDWRITAGPDAPAIKSI